MIGKLETLPAFAPMPAVSRVLAQFDRQKLGAAIEVMIALLDMTDPEAPDDEPDFARQSDSLPGDPLDHEPAGDDQDTAYIEWHELAPSTRKSGRCTTGPFADEDAEECDPAGQRDEDGINTALCRLQTEGGPGCAISDAGEQDGDELGDIAWIEWHSRGRHKVAAYGDEAMVRDQSDNPTREDDEDDDPDQALDEGEPDFAKRRAAASDGPGCAISDTDYCTSGDDRVFGGSALTAGLAYRESGPGDADDAEMWQATANVPMEAVLSADHNLFTDQRVSLGISNLQTSYRTNGSEVVSADTGRTHRTTRGEGLRPGAPV